MEKTVWILAVVLGAFVVSAHAGENHNMQDMKDHSMMMNMDDEAMEGEMKNQEAFEAEPAAGPYEEYDEYSQDSMDDETMEKYEDEEMPTE